MDISLVLGPECVVKLGVGERLELFASVALQLGDPAWRSSRHSTMMPCSAGGSLARKRRIVTHGAEEFLWIILQGQNPCAIARTRVDFSERLLTHPSGRIAPMSELIGCCRVSTSDQVTQGSATLSRRRVAPDLRGLSHRCKGLADKPRRHARTPPAGRCRGVYSLSRLSRNLRDLLALSERLQTMGVGLKSLTESIDTTTPGGRIVFAVLGAAAQLQREQLREASLEGLAAARARGRVGGWPRTLSLEQVKLARQNWRGSRRRNRVPSPPAAGSPRSGERGRPPRTPLVPPSSEQPVAGTPARVGRTARVMVFLSLAWSPWVTVRSEISMHGKGESRWLAR